MNIRTTFIFSWVAVQTSLGAGLNPEAIRFEFTGPKTICLGDTKKDVNVEVILHRTGEVLDTKTVRMANSPVGTRSIRASYRHQGRDYSATWYYEIIGFEGWTEEVFDNDPAPQTNQGIHPCPGVSTLPGTTTKVLTVPYMAGLDKKYKVFKSPFIDVIWHPNSDATKQQTFTTQACGGKMTMEDHTEFEQGIKGGVEVEYAIPKSPVTGKFEFVSNTTWKKSVKYTKKYGKENRFSKVETFRPEITKRIITTSGYWIYDAFWSVESWHAGAVVADSRRYTDAGGMGDKLAEKCCVSE